MGERARTVVRETRDGFDALLGRGETFTHQPLGRHIDPDGLAGYYCDFRHKARFASAEDPEGYPRQRYVIDIAQAALGYWEFTLEGHPVQDRFLRMADWLVASALRHPAGLVWHGPYAMPKYDLAAGWPSAMGQGEAISVLLRAHALTGSEHYRETALAAFGPMTVEVADGGVLRTTDGATVLEEYPTERLAAILNGWIFALFGVHELAVATGDPAARALFDRSTGSLLSLLPRYDVGWWSLYSLYDHGRPDLAKPFYQRLHPVLLDALALVCPDERLGHYARRWEGQLTAPHLARNAVNKIVFRCLRALPDGVRPGHER
jgi:heparosan-N-sulfate-glucuronate 5-epimerase